MTTCTSVHLAIITCEHAGNEVPPEYAHLFEGHETMLASHRGWDPGTLELGRLLAGTFHCPLHAVTTTRLLVEPNRSITHRDLFSPVTQTLNRDDRAKLLERYYFPHRNRVEETLRRALQHHQRVLHVGVHSFTPQLDDHVRNTDIGLLYDPRRAAESRLCKAWQLEIERTTRWRVRRNYPYRGNSIGLVTHLRDALGDPYLGIELEVNQRFPLERINDWSLLQQDLARTLASVIPP